MSDSYSVTPVVILIVVFLIILIVSFLDFGGIIGQHISSIYDSLVIVTIAVYVVSTIGIVRSSELVSSTEPQTPLGMLGSRGIGPFGNILGEFLQVFGFLRASQLMIIGIIFNRWDHNLPTINYIILVIVAFGLSFTALLTVFIRIRKICLDW